MVSYLSFWFVVFISRLILSYEGEYKTDEERPGFCLGHNPAVTITFVCPSKRGEEVTSIFHFVLTGWSLTFVCIIFHFY